MFVRNAAMLHFAPEMRTWYAVAESLNRSRRKRPTAHICYLQKMLKTSVLLQAVTQCKRTTIYRLLRWHRVRRCKFLSNIPNGIFNLDCLNRNTENYCGTVPSTAYTLPIFKAKSTNSLRAFLCFKFEIGSFFSAEKVFGL